MAWPKWMSVPSAAGLPCRGPAWSRAAALRRRDQNSDRRDRLRETSRPCALQRIDALKDNTRPVSGQRGCGSQSQASHRQCWPRAAVDASTGHGSENSRRAGAALAEWRHVFDSSIEAAMSVLCEQEFPVQHRTRRNHLLADIDGFRGHRVKPRQASRLLRSRTCPIPSCSRANAAAC